LLSLFVFQNVQKILERVRLLVLILRFLRLLLLFL